MQNIFSFYFIQAKFNYDVHGGVEVAAERYEKE
jgi:hypothetical protein